MTTLRLTKVVHDYNIAHDEVRVRETWTECKPDDVGAHMIIEPGVSGATQEVHILHRMMPNDAKAYKQQLEAHSLRRPDDAKIEIKTAAEEVGL